MPPVFPDDLREDEGRRLWLGGAPVSCGTGLVATEMPFAVSLAPSEKARAMCAPIEVDVGSLRPSELWTVEWRGKQVFVLRCTPEMFDASAVKYWNAYSAARDAILARTHTATAGRTGSCALTPTSCLSFLPISPRPTAWPADIPSKGSST